MLKNNICFFSESVDSKTILLKKIIDKYTPNDNYDTEQFLNSTDKYLSFTYTNNLMNILNTSGGDDADIFENNIKIMDQCTSTIFLIDCNNFS